MTPLSPSLLARVRQSLSSAEDEPTEREVWPWFTLAMLYAAGCALLALRQAFASQYMLADDVREHVFWMFRYVDPRLFPHDPIADYFQSLAPPGYASLYWLLAQLGIDPLLASKLLPSVLSLIAVGYFFGLAWRFFRSRAVATLTAILFSQALWLNSDLSSATPRAFFYPLFVAFLYYQVRGVTLGVLVAIGLEAICFPPAALLSLGVLALACLRWEKGLALAKDSHAYLRLAAAVGLTLLFLWPYLDSVGTFGPIVTYAEARRMPEFGPDGRVPFFLPSWWDYWVGGPAGIRNLPTRPPWFLAALLWPVLRHFPERFPLLKAVPRGARPVPQIIGAAILLFAIAHLLLFHFYLPSRYTQPTMRVLMILLAGGALLALIDAMLLWAEERPNQYEASHGVVALLVSAVLLVVVMGYPLVLRVFPSNSYVEGVDPNLYRFIARQPATIHLASLSDEADNLPTFSRRSIIIGAECAVPFHPAYYLPLRDRGLQIARAQYSADPAVLQKCVRDLQIDFWLLDRKAFSRKYWHKSRLLRQLRLSAPDEDLGIAKGAVPVLQRPPIESVVYEDARFLLLDMRLLLRQL